MVKIINESFLIDQHFNKLVECCNAIADMPSAWQKSAWVGKGSASWLKSVLRGNNPELIDVNPSDFNDIPLSRADLSEKIKSLGGDVNEKDLRNIVIDIFAWGSMSIRNARLALPRWKDWKEPCIALTQGCDADDAYDRFYRLRYQQKLLGIGPAYYTKIIHFIGKGDGLIMDQWTGRSINLLFGKEIVKLQVGQQKSVKSDRYYFVKQANDRSVYHAYNHAVAVLGGLLSKRLSVPVDSSQAEEYIFSFTTDRRKSKYMSENHYRIVTAWRKYVEENHRA